MQADTTKRTYNLKVRLTPDEMLTVQRNALLLRASVSDYVRSLLSIPIEVSEGPDGERAAMPGDATRLVVYERGAYAGIVRQLRAWGGHYNQAVHALNVIASKRFLRADEARELWAKSIALLEGIDAAKDGLYELAGALLDVPHAALPERGGGRGKPAAREAAGPESDEGPQAPEPAPAPAAPPAGAARGRMPAAGEGR